MTIDAATKHRPVKLSEPEKAYALLAAEPDTAVVFVHGFLGDSRSTWTDFQHLIDTDDKQFIRWNTSDLFFYAYPSHDQIVPLAEDLLRFVHNVVIPKGGRGKVVGAKPFQFPSGFTLAPEDNRNGTYKTLVLVGHSTGAIIIRQAVLGELRTLEDSGTLRTWLPDKHQSTSPILAATLRFFAPAHRGVLGAGWLGIALTLPLFQVLTTIWLHSNPLYRSLAAGNPILEDLKESTELFYAKYDKIPALKAHCLFGSKDAVVNIGAYPFDTVHETIPHESHTTICKPKANFLKPMEFLTDALHDSATGS
jgi:hypothetical protein